MKCKKNPIIESIKDLCFVIFSPLVAINRIQEYHRFIFAFFFNVVFLYILSIINSIFLKKTIFTIIKNNFPLDMINQYKEKISESFFFSPLPIIINLVIKFVFLSTFFWILISYFVKKIKFKKILSLVINLEIINSIGLFVVTVIYFLKSIKPNLKIDDIQIYIGVDIFFKNKELNLFIKTILSSINIISIWWIVICSLGITIIFKLSKTKSCVIVVILWFIFMLIQYGIINLFKLHLDNVR